MQCLKAVPEFIRRYQFTLLMTYKIRHVVQYYVVLSSNPTTQEKQNNTACWEG